MAQFKTRLLLRFDLLDNWVSANPELLAGEAAVVSIPAGYEHNGVVVTKNPLSLIKVGPGKFNDLQYIGAQAMDVNMYAKDSAKMQEFIDAWLVGKDGHEAGAVLTATVDGYKWVKPDTTTVEGLAQALASLEDRVDGVEELLNGSSEAEGLIDKVAGIDEVVNGSEEAEGLVDKVEALEEIINGNEEEGIPSLKEDILDEVDEKLDRFTEAFVFVGKDKVEIDSEGNINPVGDYVPQTGDVTFVGSKEYAYDGENWVELGDEGEHASKASVEAVAEDVAALEERIDGIADELGDLASKDKVGKDDLDEELANELDAKAKQEDLEAVEEKVDGVKEVLEGTSEEEGLIGRVDALEEEIKNPTHTHKIEDLDQEEVVIFFGGNAAGWEE